MAMTITEKILAKHADKEKVAPGELITARVDIALGNDITAPIAIKEFKKLNLNKVFDNTRVVLVPDHFCPNKDIKSADQAKILRAFANEYNITHYYDVGEMGVEHSLLPEQGVVVSGDLVIGADSHTCTYGALGAFSTGVGSTDLAAAFATGEVWLRVPESIKFIYEGKLNKYVSAKDLILYTIGDIGVDGALYKSMEFTGQTIENLPVSGRLTMANMAIEAGGKNGIIAPDDSTKKYVDSRKEREPDYYSSDEDANYSEIIKYDVSKIEPQVAFPHLPENTRGISEVGTIPIDQVVIGSCTNGLLDDLKVAANIIKGRKVAKRVRMIVIPATLKVYRDAMHEGLFDVFMDAGAIISTPTCGPCLGGHMGVLAEGERAVSTTNRNFVGRMGHPKSEVYLANPAVAAASAVAGIVAGPDQL
ncbi:3-isopropylmalate dehydratase large subunit [bacterium]|nr:3-isopropylmalate dehydratase large subunit [bacterium]